MSAEKPTAAPSKSSDRTSPGDGQPNPPDQPDSTKSEDARKEESATEPSSNGDDQCQVCDDKLVKGEIRNQEDKALCRRCSEFCRRLNKGITQEKNLKKRKECTGNCVSVLIRDCGICRLKKCKELCLISSKKKSTADDASTSENRETGGVETSLTTQNEEVAGAAVSSHESSPVLYGATDQGMLVGVFNARTIKNKQKTIVSFVQSKKISVLSLTETSLECRGTDTKDECPGMTVEGYTLLSCPRPKNQKGGGVAFMVQSHLMEDRSFKDSFSFSHTSFELAELTIRKSSPRPVHFFCLYRPRSTTMETFYEEFRGFLGYCRELEEHFIIMGDFNFPKPNKTIQEILTEFGLSQGVKHATHEMGNILDWILFREDQQVVVADSICVHEERMTSDHNPVTCRLRISSNPAEMQECALQRAQTIPSSNDPDDFGRYVAAQLKKMTEDNRCDAMRRIKGILREKRTADESNPGAETVGSAGDQ